MGRVIAAAAYNAGRRIADIPVEDSGEWAARPDHFVWIGIEAPSEPDLRQLQAQFGLHELALEDALNAHQRPSSKPMARPPSWCCAPPSWSMAISPWARPKSSSAAAT